MLDRVIERQEGISWLNLGSFFYASFMTVGMFVFISAAQPFILTLLNIPIAERAVYSGDITFYNEIVIISTVHCWGLTSDKIGRRWTWVIGAAFISLGLLLYPFATSWPMLGIFPPTHLFPLVLFRVIFALGASASSAMLVAVLADYAKPNSVGKAAGLMGFFTGLGAVFAVFMLVPVAEWTAPLFGNGTVVQSNSTDDGTDCKKETYLVAAGRTMYGTAALFTLLSGLFLAFGLKSGRATKTVIPLKRTIVEGFKSGRNPVMAMAYMAGFAARGDTIIVSVFLVLWVFDSMHGTGTESDSGSFASACEAVTRAGIVSGVVQTTALVFGPLIGLAADRLNRVVVFSLAAITGCVGYALMASTTDVLAPSIYISAVLVGIGEIGLVVTSAMLVAQESKPENRGVCSGFWGFCGSVGIMFATKLGGYLYSSWFPGAPFLIFSVINGVCALYALGIWVFKLRCPFKNVLSDFGSSSPNDYVPLPKGQNSDPVNASTTFA